ncbi:MAG: DUF2255 family protein [Candidatus Limnocylindrales bacterium]
MTEPVATFAADVLDLMARTGEVDIETHAADGTVHRTIIWVVVTDGIAYIRSYRGATARWFREITADPLGAIIAGDRRMEVRAVPATDDASVDACSRGFWAKYPEDPATRAMVALPVLSTTLRLEPR